MSALVSVLCLAIGVLLLGILLCWRILVIGNEEPLITQRKAKWWNQ